MSSKHHGGPAPVPPGNRPQAGVSNPYGDPVGPGSEGGAAIDSGAGHQERDPLRREGNFETAGEHARQQPGRLNDGDQHSR